MIRPSSIDTKKLMTWDVVLQHTESAIYKPSTWSSWAIRKLTKSKYNHTWEVLIVEDSIYVIESLWGWITLRPWEKFAIDDKFIKLYRMDGFDQKYNPKDYTIKALKQLDKKYDFLGIVKLFMFICFWYWNNPNREIAESSRRCSEFTAWMKDLDGRQRYMPKDFEDHIGFTLITHD